jgi:large subunit ribosomal protein L21
VTYAIFKAAGFQLRAELGDVLRLPSMDAESGATVTFDEVLLGASDGDVLVGRPTLQGAAVRAQVLRHGRADKIVVFKFKRRKNYRRKTGHRQGFTEVRVNEIDLGGERRVALEPEKKAKKEPKARAAAKTVAKAKPAAKKGTLH